MLTRQVFQISLYGIKPALHWRLPSVLPFESFVCSSRVSPILVSICIIGAMYADTLLSYDSRTQCYLRSEPSSRTSLTGEQPDPWKVLPLQDEMHIIPQFPAV